MKNRIPSFEDFINEEVSTEDSILTDCKNACSELLSKATKIAKDHGHKTLDSYTNKVIKFLQGDTKIDPTINDISDIMDEIQKVCLSIANKYAANGKSKKLADILFDAMTEGGAIESIKYSIRNNI